MRHPAQHFLSLDDVPLVVVVDDDDEWYGAGLCCPDDPLDKLGNYVDDALLESIGCCPTLEAPPPSVAGVGGGAVGMDVDDVSGFSRAVPGGGSGPETCAALAACRLVPPKDVPAEALPCRMPPPSLEDQPASTFNSSAVRRRRRCGLVPVRRQSWNMALPSVFLAAAAAHREHGDDHNNNDANSSPRKVSRGNGGGGKRRLVGRRQRNRQVDRKCAHCSVEDTPQWRAGPDGPGTLCNACGIRYSLGRDKLVPEYRPSMSPSFRSDEHSNRDRKVGLLREKKKTRSLKVDGHKDHAAAAGGGGGEFVR